MPTLILIWKWAELCSYTFHAFSYGSPSSRLTCWPVGNPPCQCFVTSDQDNFVGLQCTESGSVSSHMRHDLHVDHTQFVLHAMCDWLIYYAAHFVKQNFCISVFHVGIIVSSISECYPLHLLHEFGAGVCRHFMISHIRFCSTSMQYDFPSSSHKQKVTHTCLSTLPSFAYAYFV